MKHILDVAEEMDNKKEELQQDEMLDDEFSDINLPLRNLIKDLSQSAHMAIITEIKSVVFWFFKKCSIMVIL